MVSEASVEVVRETSWWPHFPVIGKEIQSFLLPFLKQNFKNSCLHSLVPFVQLTVTWLLSPVTQPFAKQAEYLLGAHPMGTSV